MKLDCRRLVLAFFSFAFLSTALAADEIKIGFITPLSGIEADEHVVLSKAFDLAIRTANEQGGAQGKKFIGVTEDSQSTAQGAAEAYQALVEKEKVTAVIATFKSAQIVAMLPKIQSAGVPTIIGGTNPRLTEDSKWTIRTRPDDTVAANAMVKYIQENTPFRKIGIIHDNGAFGKGGADLVTKFATSVSGMTIVRREGFNFGTKDFSAQIKAIKGAGAEVLIVYVANLEESSGIELEWAKQGKAMLYLGSPSSVDKVTLQKAGSASDGIHAIVDSVIGETPESKDYKQKYVKAYGEEPSPIPAYAYDGVMLLRDAIAAEGLSGGKIAAHILKLDGYRGVMGTYSFRGRGDGLHGVSVVQIEGGKQKFEKSPSF